MRLASYNSYVNIVSSQEYVDELQQLLTSAKHPQTIALLQRALSEASNPTTQLNGESEATALADSADLGGDVVMKPIMRQKDGTISMAKINNYGMHH